MTDIIDEFLAEWRKKAYTFYDNLYQEYRIKIDKIQSMSPQRWDFYHLSKEDRKKIEDNKENYKQQYQEYKKWEQELPSVIQQMMHRSESSAYVVLNKLLDREVERKKQNLIARVEKITGKIQDVSYLQLDARGDLNGFVIGDKGKAEVHTISAGGYNIQCYHYRVLVKLI